MSQRTDGAGLVSVVVPTYYRNGALRETLRSVVEQSYEPLEVVVVDDSGERHAEPVVEEFDGLTYVGLNENRGANEARNAGADVAEGAYVHFLDDDDQMYEGKTAKQIRVLREHPDVGVVYTGVETSEGRVSLPDPSVRGDVLDSALAFEMWPCMTSTMLIRRQALSAVRPFTDRPAANDIEFMIELALVTEFEHVDEPLLLKRIDRDSLGHSMAAVDGRKYILREYAHLYADRPPRVRNAALAETCVTEAEFRILEEGASLGALRPLLKNLYYTPNSKLKAAAMFIAGCFGRPGWRGVRYLGSRL